MATTKEKVRVDLNGAARNAQSVLSELAQMNQLLSKQNYRLKNIQNNTTIAGAFVVMYCLGSFALLVLGLDGMATLVGY